MASQQRESETNHPVQISDVPGRESSAIVALKKQRSGSFNNEECVVKTLFEERQREEIQGTLEFPELYQEVPNAAATAPKPIVDQNPSQEDIKYMKMAYEVAKRNPDESTQVGAIIVDPISNVILGEGWNRMPKGCEDRFGWDKQFDVLDTKYPYVLHGVRAAIIDALLKKANLEGTTLYATLIPDHIDSQLIREVGIKRVVFEEDKFSCYAFTVASKKILDGLDWRKVVLPKERPTLAESL